MPPRRLQVSAADEESVLFFKPSKTDTTSLTVDSGKSTTTGHLIYKCGGIDKRTIEKFEKVRCL